MDRNLTNLKAPIGEKDVSTPNDSFLTLQIENIVHSKESSNQYEICKCLIQDRIESWIIFQKCFIYK